MGWEEVDEGWGRLARDWAYLMEPSFWPEFDQVLRDAGVGEGTRYLDVCCGSGLAAQMAGRRGAVVHGLDASQRLIAIAAARSPYTSSYVGNCGFSEKPRMVRKFATG